MSESNTYTLTVASSQDKLFKSLAKEMGWVIQKPKKKAYGLDKAMADVRKGKVTTYRNVDDFFNKMNI